MSENVRSARVDTYSQVSTKFKGKDKRDVIFLLTLANMTKNALSDRPNVGDYLKPLETLDGQREILFLAKEFDQAIDNFNKTAGQEVDDKFENILEVRKEDKIGMNGTIPQFLGEGIIRPHKAIQEFKAGEQTLSAQNTYMSNSEIAEHDNKFLKQITESGKWSRLHLNAKSPKHFLATLLIDLYPGMLRRTGRYGEVDTDELVRALCESLNKRSGFFKLIKEQNWFTEEEFSKEFIKDIPIVIEAKHFGITLHQFTIEDAPHIFILINNDREHFKQFGDTTSKKYKTLKDVEESILHPENRERLRFGIWDNNNEFVGSINLTPDKDNHKRGEVGYYLSPHHTGKGHMLNSVLTLATHAFNKLRYDELYAKVHKKNISSQKVLLKAGFEETSENKKNKIYTLVRS